MSKSPVVTGLSNWQGSVNPFESRSQALNWTGAYWTGPRQTGRCRTLTSRWPKRGNMASNAREKVLGRVTAIFFILPPTDAKLIRSRFQLTAAIDNAHGRPVNYARAVW